LHELARILLSVREIRAIRGKKDLNCVTPNIIPPSYISFYRSKAVPYDFDQIIERRDTDSAKWRWLNQDGNEDVPPLWVADKDFVSPEPVVRALQERVPHAIFGYGMLPDDLKEVVQERLARLYGWRAATLEATGITVLA
jgi:hypothetical protein